MDLILSKLAMNINIYHISLYFIYFAVSLGLFALFFKVYCLVTNYDEMELIRLGNMSVALALSGALLGYTINLGFAMVYTQNILEYIVFAVFSAIVQIVTYKMVDKLFKNLSIQVKTYNNISIGVFYGALGVIIGILNGVSGF